MRLHRRLGRLAPARDRLVELPQIFLRDTGDVLNVENLGSLVIAQVGVFFPLELSGPE